MKPPAHESDTSSIAVGSHSADREKDGSFDIPDEHAAGLEAKGWTHYTPIDCLFCSDSRRQEWPRTEFDDAGNEVEFIDVTACRHCRHEAYLADAERLIAENAERVRLSEEARANALAEEGHREWLAREAQEEAERLAAAAALAAQEPVSDTKTGLDVVEPHPVVGDVLAKAESEGTPAALDPNGPLDIPGDGRSAVE